jgi:sporulation protein YlmC with PRC-barrel domain
MSETIDLALGVLDHQVVDSEDRRCGKVDDLELEGVREGKPAVSAIVVGRQKVVRVPWSEVQEVGSAIKLKKTAGDYRLGRGDDRARRWVEWIPGAT